MRKNRMNRRLTQEHERNKRAEQRASHNAIHRNRPDDRAAYRRAAHSLVRPGFALHQLRSGTGWRPSPCIRRRIVKLALRTLRLRPCRQEKPGARRLRTRKTNPTRPATATTARTVRQKSAPSAISATATALAGVDARKRRPSPTRWRVRRPVKSSTGRHSLDGSATPVVTQGATPAAKRSRLVRASSSKRRRRGDQAEADRPGAQRDQQHAGPDRKARTPARRRLDSPACRFEENGGNQRGR